MKSVDELLRKVAETAASDLHLKVGSPPVVTSRRRTGQPG